MQAACNHAAHEQRITMKTLILSLLVLASLDASAESMTLKDAKPTRASDEVFVQSIDKNLSINVICSPEYIEDQPDTNWTNALMEACERMGF